MISSNPQSLRGGVIHRDSRRSADEQKHDPLPATGHLFQISLQIGSRSHIIHLHLQNHVAGMEVGPARGGVFGDFGYDWAG